MTRTFCISLLALVAISTSCSTQTPNLATDLLPKTGMVVTANPEATEAGMKIIRAGGSAVDAAIAIEATLSLVEPQSSGLAGGAFLLHYDAQTKSLSSYDGRETAPMGVSPTMFLNDEGERRPYFEAKNSGLSTGVPGVLAMLQMAHEDHGKMKWSELFQHAENLANNGFEISPRLNGMITRFAKFMPKTPDQGPSDAYRYLYDEQGEPLAVGHLLKNPEYAETLKIIANDPNEFYTGEIAQKIADMVQQPPRAGSLTKQDISNYKPIKREALCQAYRDMNICGVPPASSWVAVGQIMGLLNKGPGFSSAGSDDPLNWAMFVEAQRLAYADRDKYVADTAYVQVPLEGMLNETYLEQRAQQLSAKAAVEKSIAGDPWKFEASKAAMVGVDATDDTPGTTHFVVMDQAGDVVSMTATVESVFGSTRMVGGMFLNNELTDFSWQPVDANGVKIANAVEPGKRPRSSMSPTIVLDKNNNFVMATGSPGGNNIIAYVAKSLVGVLDWGLSPTEAAALPNIVGRGDKIRAEKDRASNELVEALKTFGHNVDNSRGENSGLSIIYKHPDGRLEGGADPRREGVVGSL